MRSQIALAEDSSNIHKYTPLMVLRSAKGWYIGTLYDEECKKNERANPDRGIPGTRDSCEYYETQKEAQFALDNDEWTRRFNI